MYLHKCIKSLPVLMILVAYIAVQLFAISGPYFPLDDLLELWLVNTYESEWQVFGPDCFHLFRPVKNLIFALFSIVPNDMTWLCRLVAIVIGGISIFPVLALFRRIFRDERLALCATAVWALSPTLVSSVAWLSCVNIQMMCAFAATTIVLHDKAFDNDGFRGVFVWLAAMMMFFACVSYELAVALCPLVVVFDFYLRSDRLAKKRAYLVYLGYTLITLLYLLLRWEAGATAALDGNFIGATRQDMSLASPFFTCQHLFVWFWPFGRMAPLGAYSPGEVPVVVLVSCWIFVLSLAVASLALRRRLTMPSFGIAFFFVSFLPVSNLLGLGNGPYGDYYLGLPSIGLSVFVVFTCARLLSVKNKWRIVCFLIGVTIVASRCFAVPEAMRWAWLWSDGARAFRSGIDVFPNAFGNWKQYASICYENGRFSEMEECCKWLDSRLSSDSEKMIIVYQLRALVAMNIAKDSKVAMQNLNLAMQVKKDVDRHRTTRYYRGCVYEDLLGDEENAIVEYRAAIDGKWTPDSALAADRLARLLAIAGEFDEAESLWAKAARIRPEDDEIRHNLIQVRLDKAKSR